MHNNTTLNICPQCQKHWRPIEITLQACEKCLYIAPKVGAIYAENVQKKQTQGGLLDKK